MDIIKFLEEFTTDKMTQNYSRRAAFGTIGSLGKKAAMVAIPFGLATMTSKAYAQNSSDGIAALQLALTLEYLEDQFYDLGLQSGVIDSQHEQIFMQISQHEQAHVDFLTTVLENAGANIPGMPTFDFTAGGMFDPFNDNGTGQETAYAQFLALSQAFEDTGVRAYKGQALNLMNTDYLSPALQIHSVEARHASEVRRLRGLKGWITQDNRGPNMPEATQPVYNGEDNLTQLGVDVTTVTEFGADAVTQAFDEPMTAETAQAIAGLFIVD